MKDVGKAARGVAKDFLKYLDDPLYGGVARRKRITLFGADEHTLNAFKQELSNYFIAQNQQVTIELGKEDYDVNVSWCLNRYK